MTLRNISEEPLCPFCGSRRMVVYVETPIPEMPWLPGEWRCKACNRKIPSGYPEGWKIRTEIVPKNKKR